MSLESSSPILTNNILWGDSSLYNDEIVIFENHDPSEPDFNYCNIADTLWPGEGNISVDPLFRDPESGDFHLMAIECGDPLDSPCIDAGDPAIADYLLDCDWGLGSQRSDMGAYGGQAIPTDIPDREPRPDLPARLCLSQNYPNPFNSSTVINYWLPDASFVILSIYNVLGQLEETIFEGTQPEGHRSAVWNADNYPSGIYFARVQAGDRSGSIRMVVIK